MPTEELSAILDVNNGANFVKLVDSWDGSAEYVILSQRAFYGEPDLLYIAIRYASLNGVTLLFAPESERSPDAGK